MSLLQAGFGSSGDDYEITDSLRLRSSASAYLARTPLSAGNRRTWTWSGWVKLGTLDVNRVFFDASPSSTSQTRIRVESGNALDMIHYTGSTVLRLKTTALFRDPSAWYHFVISVDTTQSTAADRMSMYVNGVEQTSFSSRTDPSQNLETNFNNNIEHRISSRDYANDQYWDGYLTEVNWIDGQALDADDFGEYDANGTWKAKQYTGTYGTNGFYLPMKPTTQANGFNTVLYTGDSGTQSISGVGFSPDFVWIKPRNAVGSHILQDTVRGNTKFLESNSTGAEQTNSSTGLLSFDSDGFTVGSGNDWNNSGETFVAWAWDAGSGSAASNTNGSITSTVKANDTYGFSIASYTGNGSVGATVGHGLGTTPAMIIIKKRNTTGNWIAYHAGIGINKFIYLNLTSSASTASPTWGVSSTTFTLQQAFGDYNTNGATYIAYCFAEVAGYSKIGSFQNNNSTSGVTVTTGFRPGFIILKCTDAGERWFILDNARQVNNVSPPSTAWLVPNDNAAEGANGATTATIDFLDNGFQIKTTDPSTGEVSFGTRTYIYMAIADTADARFNFDASGNKNNWTPNNINSNAESETTYDLMKDTPSLVDENAANFATWNPATPSYRAAGTSTLSNGNLTSTDNASSYGLAAVGTIPVSSGKWYWEVDATSIGGSYGYIGIAKVDTLSSGSSNIEGYIYSNLGLTASGAAAFAGIPSTSYGASWATGDVIGVALDMDAGTLVFYKNGVSQGTAFSSITGEYVAGVGDGQTATAYVFDINFGQRPFAYTPPSGFLKLNTFNLSDSTIEDGSDYFNTVLYTGTGSTQSITGVGFQPDLVWAKDRGATVHHTWTDAVRGVHLDLFSSSTSQESNDTNGLTAFNADGYSLGSSTNHNVSAHTYVGWNWLAGNSTSTNTSGSVNSTVSVSTTAGFSVVGFTAPSGTGNFTAGHGLGVTPGMVIVKTRDSSSAPWYTWHNTFSNLTDDYMRLNATNVKQTQTDGWGAGMTSSVIGLKAGSTTVATEDHIAYCFAAKAGYSAIASYLGNGSTDGPFVYTGFRPAWILVKLSLNQINAASWQIYDTTRNTFNVIPTYLFADSAGAESDTASTYFNADILSNGFKIRAANTYGINQSGATYIYMAFAENPFKNANAR